MGTNNQIIQAIAVDTSGTGGFVINGENAGDWSGISGGGD
jgi:hypothetical protein